MFDHHDSGIGLPGEYLWSGGSRDETEMAHELTCRLLADGWEDDERHFLPDELADIPVGPYLAAIVASADRSRLNGFDAVRLMQTEARLVAAFEARKLGSMVEVAHSPPGNSDSPVERSPQAMEYAAVEIAAALRLTRRASETELDRALALTRPLARVWERLAEGQIDVFKMRVFVNALGHLADDLVDAVLDRSLDDSSELTTGQLRARLSRLVLEVDPQGVEHGLEAGLADRKVVAYSNPDFTASLAILSADPADVTAAMGYVDRIARHLKTGDEPRTLDQIRNDVALDLLRGKKHGATGGDGRVAVTIPAATLEALADEPGVIEGFGPVTAEIAHKVAMSSVDGEWTFTVTDNGQPVATGTLARRPTSSQQRRLRAEYPTCTFVGCRRPARECDLDHRRPFSQGGPTHNDNLSPLCRHHHMAKHHAPWQQTRRRDGSHQWVSPLGHRYVKTRAPPPPPGESSGHPTITERPRLPSGRDPS